LYLVRHGQSRANVDATHNVIDCDLTDKGREQAMAVASELARRGVDHVIASPYVRTLLTAREILRATGATSEVMVALHEHHANAFPTEWPLQTKSNMATNYPEFQLGEEMPETWWHRPPESMDAIAARMRGVLELVRQRFATNDESRVVLVSHATPIQHFVHIARPTSTQVAPSVLPIIDNAALCLVDVKPDTSEVVFINHTEHLRMPVVLP
jgi:broad specificity phosphatase PhoE